MKVLVVSQDPAVSAQVANALLDDEEVQLLEVRTPHRALALVDEDGAETTWDLVVADADTAPEGGFSLAREIKARGRMDRRLPPVVLLIARDGDKYLAKWSEADAFVVKPADPFDLHQVVVAVVAGDEVPDLPGVGGTARMREVLQTPDGAMTAPIASAGY